MNNSAPTIVDGDLVGRDRRSSRLRNGVGCDCVCENHVSVRRWHRPEAEIGDAEMTMRVKTIQGMRE